MKRLMIAISLVVAAVLARRLVRYEIVEPSMAPTLRHGDWVIALRGTGGRRGEVVVLEHPSRPGLELVKRVVARDGSTVEIRDGLVLIDGTVVTEPYAAGTIADEGRWVLGDGEAFVLSDNRQVASIDSTVFGPIRIADITARVIARYRPDPMVVR